ncbi:MAG: cation:proton antiporter, partial [Deinococcota bacterium]
MLTPIHNPVLIMALAMGLFLVVPLLFERIRLPSIIGLILAGALVGPHGLNLLERDETIQLLGTVGLLYLMFVAGLELDLVGFIKHRTSSLTFGLLTFAFPMILPLVLMPFFGLSWAEVILIGAIVASHTPIAYPIASRLGISKNPAITAAMGGTLVTDTLSLVVLAIITSYVDGASSVQFWIIKFALLAAFCFVVLQGLPRLGRWFFRYVGNQPIAQYAFLLTVLFATAFLAEELRSKDLIGAFLAGLALNRLVPDTSALMNRLQFVGNSLFMPFFLLSVGMLVDAQVLTDPNVWLLAAMLSVILLVGKGLAAVLSQRLFKYSPAQGFLMLGMSLPQAAATLAVTFVGYDIGLFDESMINAVVVLIMFSCLLGPW